MAQLPVESPTIRAHRQQRFWQILFPILLFIALILAAGGFVIAAETGETRLWADISTIWLIAPVLIIILLGTILLGLLIYAMIRLTKALPRFTSRAQDVVQRISSGTLKAADAAVKPILWVKQAGSILETLLYSLLRRS